MNQPRNADEIFQAALDRPAAEREAWCREVCGDDPALLDEVLELLSFDPGTGGQPFGDAPMRVGPAGLQVGDPERVGPFRILQRLGSGGFGVVYEAEQSEPIRRRIALKIVKAGMDSEEILARFDAERQALALMDHPNIARVLDVGTTEQGRPWFAMELVRGDPVTRFADDERLDIQARIRLFLQICQAVQHAHQKGIIHRDLKPSNLLVARVDGAATPKVIDFGIAKALTTRLVDRTLHTVSGSVMGTPMYMSPEQAGTSRLDVDTSSDVYSLGVVLYELLSGFLPIGVDRFDHTDPTGYAEIIRQADPSPPSERHKTVGPEVTGAAAARDTDPWTLRSQISGDLDWICMRAISTDRARRYQTVQELQAELERYQTNEPVLAGPPTIRYRLGKFARRHRVELTLAAVILFALLGSGAALTWALVESNEQRRRAEEARAESEAVVTFLSEMLAAPRPTGEGRDVTVAEVIDYAADPSRLDFPDQPLVEARLRAVIGATYHELGRFEEAELQLQRALETQEAEYGAGHEITLATLKSLGDLYTTEARYDEAVAAYHRIVDERRARHPEGSRDLARALQGLGSIFVGKVQPDSALRYLDEASAMAERHAGEGDVIFGDLSNDLGLAWSAKGEYEKAEPYLVAGYRIDLERFGRGTPQMATSSQNLGELYRQMGRYDDAVGLYREGYETAVIVYGEEHPNTIRAISNLALVLSDAGRYDEALEFSSRAVEIRERTVGPAEIPTLVSRINYAQLRFRRGEYDIAEASLRETIRRLQEAMGADHFLAIVAEGMLGETMREQGRAQSTIPFMEYVVARAEEVIGPDHWRTAHMQVTLVSCLIDVGRLDDARALLEPALANLRAGHDESHFRVQRAVEQLERLR